jgi:cytochrome c-type biogenesis protein CcmH
MTQTEKRGIKRPSTATIILGAAGILAVASAAVALTRDGDKTVEAAAPHGAIKPDQPVGDVNSMIASLEGKLKQNPNDANGWRLLGWSQFETGDLMKAAQAYRRAAQIEPNNAENWSSLGEALQVASTDVSPKPRLRSSGPSRSTPRTRARATFWACRRTCPASTRRPSTTGSPS